MTIRPLVWTILLVPFLHAAPAPSPRAAVDTYHRQLTAKCPDKHLEFLSPASLSDLNDDFLPHLSRPQRRRVQASIARNCRGVDMGATCGNVGFLQAVIQLHKLDTFTTEICATQQICTGQSACTDTR